MPLNLEYLFYGMLGAVCMELLQPQIYRGRLTAEKLHQLYRSPVYWISVVSLVLGSGILAWGLHADDSAKIRDVFITGLAARTILRELITSAAQKKGRSYGKIDIKDVFS